MKTINLNINDIPTLINVIVIMFVYIIYLLYKLSKKNIDDLVIDDNIDISVNNNVNRIVYIDMDGVLCDYYGRYLEQKSDTNYYPQSRYGFFRNLEPIEGAIETVNKLIEYGYDVYILTSPSVQNPLSYTEKREWIEKYLGLDMCYKLILSPNKTLLKGSYLIDDNIHEGFEGELIHFGKTDKFKNWKDVEKYLIK
jgi:5'(3')-deoxyribonucleotidase